MLNLVSLLAAAALVSMQGSFEVRAQLSKSAQDLDNNIPPNVAPSIRRKPLRNFVHIMVPNVEVVRHIIGTPLELNCEAMGSPAPSIHWLKNGERINEYSDEANEIQPTSRVSLARLHSKLITIPEPGDMFTCVATSGAKVHTADTRVLGVEAGENLDASLAYQKLYSLKPHIVSYYEEIFVESKSPASIVLLCRVHSYGPRQEVYWEKNNEPIYDNSKMTILPTGDLLIADLHWNDMAEYTCTVKNLYGKDTIKTFLYPASNGQ